MKKYRFVLTLAALAAFSLQTVFAQDPSEIPEGPKTVQKRFLFVRFEIGNTGTYEDRRAVVFFQDTVPQRGKRSMVLTTMPTAFPSFLLSYASISLIMKDGRHLPIGGESTYVETISDGGIAWLTITTPGFLLDAQNMDPMIAYQPGTALFLVTPDKITRTSAEGLQPLFGQDTEHASAGGVVVDASGNFFGFIGQTDTEEPQELSLGVVTLSDILESFRKFKEYRRQHEQHERQREPDPQPSDPPSTKIRLLAI